MTDTRHKHPVDAAIEAMAISISAMTDLTDACEDEYATSAGSEALASICAALPALTAYREGVRQPVAVAWLVAWDDGGPRYSVFTHEGRADQHVADLPYMTPVKRPLYLSPPDVSALAEQKLKGPEAIRRLQDAVEGECEGLAIDEKQARSILRYILAKEPTDV